jgi:hypothetical protein
VKAGEDALEAASIAAPAMTPIAPRDRKRKSMVFLQVFDRPPDDALAT